MSGPIIITMPKYLGASNPRGILDEAMENASVIANSQAKKRRLDHLSWEEKVQRKKLKNRVAAQTSRDRKKARMDELQDEVSSLKSEIERLRLQNQRLTVENTDLKQKLTCPDKTRPSSCVGCEALLGSAVSLLPLPQEGLSQPAPLEGDRKTGLVYLNAKSVLTLVALISQICWKSSTQTSASKASPRVYSQEMLLKKISRICQQMSLLYPNAVLKHPLLARSHPMLENPHNIWNTATMEVKVN